MPRPLTDTDTDTLLFGSNSETDEENGSNYDPSSDEDEEDAIADNDSEQTSEEEKDSGPVRRSNIPSRPTTVTMLTSKNGKEVWHTDPIVNGGRRRVSNILKTAPGPTRYANRQVDTDRHLSYLFKNLLLR